VKLRQWEQKNNWQGEAFYPKPDVPKNPYRCLCGVEIFSDEGGSQICEESWMWAHSAIRRVTDLS